MKHPRSKGCTNGLLKKKLTQDRFLVIREYGTAGMCACLMHVVNSLLYAQLTNRIPIVYWGKGSSYYDGELYPDDGIPKDVFVNYFEAISPYSIQDVIGRGFTYYPPFWTDKTILGCKFAQYGPLPYNLGFPGSDVNILVGVKLQRMEDLRKQIPADHEFSGFSRNELFYKVYNKNIKLKNELKKRIDTFYDKYFHGGPIIGVHVRATDKITEQPIPRLNQIIRKTNCLLKNRKDAKIFLATDSQKVLNKFLKLFPDRLIFTDSIRSKGKISVHHSRGNSKEKGDQILQDIYLLSKCDHLVLSMTSGIAYVVLFMLMDPAISENKSTIVNPNRLDKLVWNLSKKIETGQLQIRKYLSKILKIYVFKDKKALG